jgi:hypothetical protein
MAQELETPPSGFRRAAVVWIVIGCAAYGYTLGMGRGALMGFYVAIKLPLLIFLTLSINAILNGILAQVLGSGLSFRQTWAAILRSFALFALIVGSLSPVAAYFTMNAVGHGDAGKAHAMLLLVHVVVMASAGIVANLQLLNGLRLLLPAGIALQVLFAWLLGNLFVGAQFSYLLRPFFGQPKLEIEFLRPDAFTGNFYSAVWNMSRNFLGTSGVMIAIAFGLFIFLLCLRKHSNPNPTL